MKILVTGGAGFIGSHVAEQFLAGDHEVVIVDDCSSGKERNVPKGATFRKMDIRSDAFARLIVDFKPQAISHLAAQIDVRKSMADPIWDAEINVLGLIRLAHAASRANTAKVIFSSTGGAIYGDQSVFPAPESHPCQPLSAYGTSKLCGENYFSFFERAGGPKFVGLRYANVYGPRQDPHGEAGVVAIFSQKMLRGEKPTIYGDGKQTRDFVYVKDVARANRLALEKDVTGVFNIGTGAETDVNRLAEIIAKESGYQGSIGYQPARPGEQYRSVVDPSKAKQVLGWNPSVSLEEGLKETVNFFRTTRGR